MSSEDETFDGGCACKSVRYRLNRAPMFVHCCHCTWCQRETGSAFAVNALIEATEVVVLEGSPESIETPSASGKGQLIVRCPTCRVAVWSHYAGGGPQISFIRVGTLDAPGRCPPDIHIYTSTKLPWVVLPPGATAVPEFYVPKEQWPADAQQRFRALHNR